MAYVGMAEVLYERNQLDQALRHATAAASLAILAWTYQALGDPAAARAAIEDAYRLIPAGQVAALHNLVPAERARLGDSA